jgi:signal transduction histidine kinase
MQAERDQTRTALHQAQKMDAIGRLAAGIAHEINTPSQYVLDNITFLRDAMSDLRQLLDADESLRTSIGVRDHPLARAVDAIAAKIDLAYLLDEIPKSMDQSLEGMDRIRRIVVAMREFSHPTAETTSPADLNHIIETSLTISKNEWKYVATVELGLSPDLPLVQCMPGEISQVILNLIVNASHAIADTIKRKDGSLGVLTISTTANGDWAEIRIGDTGAGIPMGIRDRIYEPFFTTKGIGKGTGQGLALAWAVVVEKHHGTLTFDSTVGTGTTFLIRLPIAGSPT